MHTNFAIDWIRVTTKEYAVSQLIQAYSFGFPVEEWHTFSPKNGYNCGLQHPMGFAVMWSSVRDDMGVNMLFDGRSCHELHEAGVDLLRVVKDFSDDGFKFTRLDLAIDIHGVDIDIVGLLDCEHTGSANNDPVLVQKGKQARGGATLYAGARQSEKFMRIYDKAKERKLPDIMWTRVELELKSVTATKIAAKIATMTYQEVSEMTRGMMRGVYDPDNKTFRDALAVDPIKIGSTKNEEHNTYEWIMTSVAKTMAKLIVELPHRDVMPSFEKEVQKYIREMAARRSAPLDDIGTTQV